MDDEIEGSTVELEVSITFNIFLEGYDDEQSKQFTKDELFAQGLEVALNDFVKNDDWVIGHSVKFVKVTYS